MVRRLFPTGKISGWTDVVRSEGLPFCPRDLIQEGKNLLLNLKFLQQSFSGTSEDSLSLTWRYEAVPTRGTEVHLDPNELKSSGPFLVESSTRIEGHVLSVKFTKGSKVDMKLIPRLTSVESIAGNQSDIAVDIASAGPYLVILAQPKDRSATRVNFVLSDTQEHIAHCNIPAFGSRLFISNMYISQLSADSYQASITMSGLDTRKNNRGDASHTCKLNTTDGDARLWTLNMPTQAGDVQSYIYQYLKDLDSAERIEPHTRDQARNLCRERQDYSVGISGRSSCCDCIEADIGS